MTPQTMNIATGKAGIEGARIGRALRRRAFAYCGLTGGTVIAGALQMLRGVALAALLGAALLPMPAAANVLDSDEGGFSISIERTTPLSPAESFALLGQPALWWADAHTWSGDAASMRMTPQQAGGCWCETLPNMGSVEHGHIMLWDPEHGRVLMRAELGPLQGKAATGKLEWIAVAGPDGQTHIGMRYDVTGRHLGDVAALADVVDMVLGQQMDRFIRRAARGGVDAPPLAQDAPGSSAGTNAGVTGAGVTGAAMGTAANVAAAGAVAAVAEAAAAGAAAAAAAGVATGNTAPARAPRRSRTAP
ncbi:MAG: hypothetical protein ACKOUM_03025 [Sphingopyxis sp.]